MKKILWIIVILILCLIGYFTYNKLTENRIKKLTIEEQVINIDKVYMYGPHLNFEGSNIPEEELSLILYNGEFINIPIIKKDNNTFITSNTVNEGIFLDNLENNNYFLFLESITKEQEKEIKKYYSLNNVSEYPETIYYSLSQTNKKITITSEEEYPTMLIIVEDNKDEEIYDIVLDPGHGGIDGGASKYGSKETDFTLPLAKKVKALLEEQNIKVKLTRETNLTKNEKLPEYGVHGRAAIPGEVHAKYLISFHLNSSTSTKVKGLEIYTAQNINYDFAKKMASNIVEQVGLSYSNNGVNKIANGIYTRMFTNADIKSSIKEYESAKKIPYDFSTKSNYYYIIRETGGIITGAYVDDRNPNNPGNPNYKSNTGTEAYILELGYITNKSDLNNMKNNMDKYAETIANTIIEQINSVK